MAGATKRVVLVGAGHAHLYVAKHAGRLVRAGAEVVLVDPDRFWYSGLATGMLGGRYDAEEDQVDAGALVERGGGRFVRDRLAALDRGRRVALLESGRELPYDVVSLNVGSEIATGQLAGSEDHAWTAKPTRNLWRLRRRLEELLGRGGNPLRVIVAGGGATGCEVAANVAALARRHGAPVELMLISRSRRLLPRQRLGVSRRVAAMLGRGGVMVSHDCAVDEVHPARLVCSDGRRPEYDVLVAATGLVAPPLVAGLGLPLGSGGGLLVGPTLQSVGDEGVLAVGDCADLAGRPLPRLGVFAVRQSPVLLHNLEAALSGTAFSEYRPQRVWLSILNLGGDRGLALWGPLSVYGRLPMVLKDRIDRRFMASYRDP